MQAYLTLLTTETWRYRWNDFWGSLCYHDDGTFFDLHRTDLQWILFCPIWTFWAFCIRLSWYFMQVLNSVSQLLLSYFSSCKRLTSLVFQGCYFHWFNKGSWYISIWCGSQVAWHAKWVTFSQLFEDEDVYPTGSSSNESRNYTELLQCKILWRKH